MIAYIESFSLAGMKVSIEDYKDGKPKDDHFMPEQATKRFRLWSGGSSFGQASSLQEARKAVYDYAQMKLIAERQRLDDRLEVVNDCLAGLGDENDTALLFRFETK